MNLDPVLRTELANPPFTDGSGSAQGLRAFLDPLIDSRKFNEIGAAARALQKADANSARQYTLLKPQVMQHLVPKNYNEEEFVNDFAKTCEFMPDNEIAAFVRSRMPSLASASITQMILPIIRFGHCAALQAVLELLPPYYSFMDSNVITMVVHNTLMASGKMRHGTFMAVCLSKWSELGEFFCSVFKALTPYGDERSKLFFAELYAVVMNMITTRRFVETVFLVEDVLMNPLYSDKYIHDHALFKLEQKIAILQTLFIPSPTRRGGFVPINVSALFQENIDFDDDAEKKALLTLHNWQINAQVTVTMLQEDCKAGKIKRDMYFNKYIYKLESGSGRGGRVGRVGRGRDGDGGGSDDDDGDGGGGGWRRVVSGSSASNDADPNVLFTELDEKAQKYGEMILETFNNAKVLEGRADGAYLQDIKRLCKTAFELLDQTVKEISRLAKASRFGLEDNHAKSKVIENLEMLNNMTTELNFTYKRALVDAKGVPESKNGVEEASAVAAIGIGGRTTESKSDSDGTRTYSGEERAEMTAAPIRALTETPGAGATAVTRLASAVGTIGVGGHDDDDGGGRGGGGGGGEGGGRTTDVTEFKDGTGVASAVAAIGVGGTGGDLKESKFDSDGTAMHTGEVREEITAALTRALTEIPGAPITACTDILRLASFDILQYNPLLVEVKPENLSLLEQSISDLKEKFDTVDEHITYHESVPYSDHNEKVELYRIREDLRRFIDALETTRAAILELLSTPT